MRPQDVRAACKAVYGVSPGNRSRGTVAVRSRQTFAMICREVLMMSLEEIAKLIRMDHTTVIYHLKRAPDNVRASQYEHVMSLARRKFATAMKKEARREAVIEEEA